MMYQDIFKRVEKKYLLTDRQYRALFRQLSDYMTADAYGRHTICSIYYDTDDYRLIRASLAKPKYKEKLRLRSYGVPTAHTQVFAELKKKYDGVVYKRRAAMTLESAELYLGEGVKPFEETQILHEIDAFMDFYRPKPKMFIGCDRLALYGKEDNALRVTFDDAIRWRTAELSLECGDHGTLLLPQGTHLMELKISNSVPLWLSRLLAQNGVYPTTFSKYGKSYLTLCKANAPEGGVLCA